MKVYSASIPEKYLTYAAVTLAHIVHSRTLITRASYVDELIDWTSLFTRQRVSRAMERLTRDVLKREGTSC